MSDTLLSLDAVAVSFGPQAVLRGVSLAVRPGETVALIGESGCGKSVTLKLMVGLLTPDAGGVAFEGKPLRGLAGAGS